MSKTLEILYQDEHMVVINKPNGLLVHRSSIANDVDEFSVQLLRDQIGQFVYPVHRLDRKTSGVLVFALDKETTRLLQEEMQQKQLDTNFRIMEQIRARVDNIVEDPKTAASLKPYYNYGCKRPTFHDEYLPTFNQSHVTLIDTAPRGVAEINENGIIHEGVEYPLDVLIYATGFQWMATQTFSMIKGREGLTLKDKWAQDGTKTFLGLQTKGFPNMFIISGPQGGGGSFNFTGTIEDHGDYVLWMLETMRDQGADVVDINEEAQVEYAKHCAQVDTATQPLRDCISYYDHEGKAEPGALVYYGGRMWHQYRTKGQETLAPYAFESKD